MANSRKNIARNTKTPIRPLVESISVSTIAFILGNRLTVLSGLKILKVRNALSPPPLFTYGKNPIHEVITTKKSSQFQKLLKYASLWKMKPLEMILQEHSKAKMAVNARSN